MTTETQTKLDKDASMRQKKLDKYMAMTLQELDATLVELIKTIDESFGEACFTLVAKLKKGVDIDIYSKGLPAFRHCEDVVSGRLSSKAAQELSATGPRNDKIIQCFSTISPDRQDAIIGGETLAYLSYDADNKEVVSHINLMGKNVSYWQKVFSKKGIRTIDAQRIHLAENPPHVEKPRHKFGLDDNKRPTMIADEANKCFKFGDHYVPFEDVQKMVAGMSVSNRMEWMSKLAAA